MSAELVFRDRDGACYQPVRHHNQSTGRSAFRVKPVGASNRTEDCLELNTIEEFARAMLVDGLPARVRASSGGPVNYLRFGAEKLVSYELDERIAERLGIPPRAGARQADWREGDRGAATSGSAEILAHFDVDPGFCQARARWTDDQTRAFVAFAQAIHETGLDWYFVTAQVISLEGGIDRSRLSTSQRVNGTAR